MGSYKPSDPQPFPPGIHVPSLTWFKNDDGQEIDWELQRQHLEFLVESGLDGIVIAGTNGEAVTLSADEKSKLLKMTREITTRLGRPGLTITMGCSGHSTRAVISETKLAKEAGADYVLVLVPSYFHFAMTNDAIVAFFEEVSLSEIGCRRKDKQLLTSCRSSSSLMRAPLAFSFTTFQMSLLALTLILTCSLVWGDTRTSSVLSLPAVGLRKSAECVLCSSQKSSAPSRDRAIGWSRLW